MTAEHKMDVHLKLEAGPISLKSYHEALIAALDDETVRIYLDTSVLLWLTKIGAEARNEFSRWALSHTRVHVVAWTIHELARHLPDESEHATQAKSIHAQLQTVVSDIRASADESLTVSSGFAKTSDLAGYVAGAAQKLEDIWKRSFSRLRYDAARKTVVDIVNKLAASTPLFTSATGAHSIYLERSSFRIPPGYGDAHKELNSAGDLVFWRECLHHAKSVGANGLIIITRDEKKGDWTKAPSRLLMYNEKEREKHPMTGIEVVQPHPTLAYEAQLVHGLSTLHIISPRVLSIVLDRKFRVTGGSGLSPCANLVFATLRDDSGSELPNWAAFGETPVLVPESRPSDVSSSPQPPSPLSCKFPTTDSIMDQSAEALMGSFEANPTDRLAFVHNMSGTDLFNSLSTDDLFNLGRRVLRISDFHPGLITDIVITLRSSGGEITSCNQFVVGMLIELYFEPDPAGLGSPILRQSPLESAWAELLTVAELPEFLASYIAIEEMLLPHTDNIPYIPGPSAKQQDVQLELALGNELIGIRLGIHDEVLFDCSSDDVRSIPRLLGASHVSMAQLIQLIIQQYFIPRGAIRVAQEDKNDIKLRSDLGLRILDTSLGGIVEPIFDTLPDGETP